MTEAKSSRKTGKQKREDESEENHCICESRDYTTLMICCDYCSIWYHAKCMNLTKSQVDQIKKYACKPCQKKDKKVVYNKEATDIKGQGKRRYSKGNKNEKKIKIESIKKEESTEPSNKRRKKSTSIAVPVKTEPTIEQQTDTAAVSLNLNTVKTEPLNSSDQTEPVSSEQRATPTIPLSKNYQLQEEYPQLRCNDNCIGCYRDEDCGKCAICLQANGKLCIQRVCVKIEELFRQLQEKVIKTEDQEENGKNQGKKKGRKPKQFHVGTINEPNLNDNMEPKKRYKHQAGIGKGKNDISMEAQLNKVYCNWIRSKQKQNNKMNSRNTQQTTNSNAGPMELVKDMHMQCYGPDCINSVRRGSRYCSEKCGLALAELRLKAILPQRINNYFGQIPTNQTADSKRLEQLEAQVDGIQDKLAQLEKWKDNVHNYLGAIKEAQPSGERERAEDESLVVGCPVCGGEFSMREISKHSQSCYVRSERQTTYGTDYKVPNDIYSLYCDAYNKINNTYCKRLRYSCAEHYKDEYDMKICGCPLNWFKNGSSLTFQDLFASSEAMMGNVEYCQEKRKNCRDHINWIQTAFSLIDNERMNLINRLEEIREKQHITFKTYIERGDILTLLTSRTQKAETNTTDD